MAYALGFPKDVTELLYSLRDWRWEMVRDNGGTPSRLCFEIGMPPSSEDAWKPRLWPLYMPYYQIQDQEDSEYGENLMNRRSRVGEVRIERYSPRADCVFPIRGIRGIHFKHFTLRTYLGGVPVKFRKLQEQNDSRVKETWFQCEPCAAP